MEPRWLSNGCRVLLAAGLDAVSEAAILSDALVKAGFEVLPAAANPREDPSEGCAIVAMVVSRSSIDQSEDLLDRLRPRMPACSLVPLWLDQEFRSSQRSRLLAELGRVSRGTPTRLSVGSVRQALQRIVIQEQALRGPTYKPPTAHGDDLITPTGFRDEAADWRIWETVTRAPEATPELEAIRRAFLTRDIGRALPLIRSVMSSTPWNPYLGYWEARTLLRCSGDMQAVDDALALALQVMAMPPQEDRVEWFLAAALIAAEAAVLLDEIDTLDRISQKTTALPGQHWVTHLIAALRSHQVFDNRSGTLASLQAAVAASGEAEHTLRTTPLFTPLVDVLDHETRRCDLRFANRATAAAERLDAVSWASVTADRPVRRAARDYAADWIAELRDLEEAVASAAEIEARNRATRAANQLRLDEKVTAKEVLERKPWHDLWPYPVAVLTVLVPIGALWLWMSQPGRPMWQSVLAVLTAVATLVVARRPLGTFLRRLAQWPNDFFEAKQRQRQHAATVIGQLLEAERPIVGTVVGTVTLISESAGNEDATAAVKREVDDLIQALGAHWVDLVGTRELDGARKEVPRSTSTAPTLAMRLRDLSELKRRIVRANAVINDDDSHRGTKRASSLDAVRRAEARQETIDRVVADETRRRSSARERARTTDPSSQLLDDAWRDRR